MDYSNPWEYSVFGVNEAFRSEEGQYLAFSLAGDIGPHGKRLAFFKPLFVQLLGLRFVEGHC